MSIQLAMTIPEAAAAVSVSPDTIRRAIRKTAHDEHFPPPLSARRLGDAGPYRIGVAALTKWFDALPTA